VNAKSDVARDVGDEALLLARTAPTLVARDRRAGLHAIENGPHPVTVVVMDDGLQNPSVAKSLTLAVVDGRRGLGNGLVMPAGPLRAPLRFQLELADAVVVNGTGAEPSVAEWLRHRFAGPVLRVDVTAAGDTGWLKSARVVAWAGIGAPQRFFDTVRGLGADLAEAVAFRDHQHLAEGDAANLLELAKRHAAALVTTEKDLARLTGASAGSACARLAEASRALAIKLEMATPEAERLMSLVDAALRTHGA
jgi:tetraacyldisaccharide 4'-kinase